MLFLASFSWALIIGSGLVSAGLGIFLFQKKYARQKVLLLTSATMLLITWILGNSHWPIIAIICMFSVLLLSFKLIVKATTKIANRYTFASLVIFMGFLTITSTLRESDIFVGDTNAEDVTEAQKIAHSYPELESDEHHWLTDKGTSIVFNTPSEKREKTTLEEMELKLLESFQWHRWVIQLKPASDQSNCHGWVFTNGESWVLGHHIPVILSENGYRQTEKPQTGDLVIYKKDDVIIHTAIVRSTGDVTIVESKWGWMGVYLHEVNHSCYGTTIEYYQSNRDGHVLFQEGSNLLGEIDY